MPFIYKQSLCNIWDTTTREIVMNVKGLKNIQSFLYRFSPEDIYIL